MQVGAKPHETEVTRFRRDLESLIDVEADKVLVAVSGGADSVALLLLMHAALGDRCIAATVNHGLRAAAAGEAAFVARLCAERGIDHTILTGAMPGRAGRTANVSARARLLRYRLLEEHAALSGETWVATAHHADDQLETLVMRLNRGAGTGGLSGIRRSGGLIIRPLLGWRRGDLAALVSDCGIVPVDDPSNADDRYDRARLRKALVEVDWLDVERVALSAAALGEAEDALAWTARRLFEERCRADGDGLVLDAAALPAELTRRLVRTCVERIDPRSEPSGPGLSRLIDSLRAGRSATLGAVLAVVPHAPGGTDPWRFSPAPPRRPSRAPS